MPYPRDSGRCEVAHHMVLLLQPHAVSLWHRDPRYRRLRCTKLSILWLLPACMCFFQQELGSLEEFTKLFPLSTNKTIFLDCKCPQRVVLKAGLFAELCLLMLNALWKKEAGQVLSEAKLSSGEKIRNILFLANIVTIM